MAEVGPTPPATYHTFMRFVGRRGVRWPRLAPSHALFRSHPCGTGFSLFRTKPQLGAFYCLLARFSRPNPLSIYLMSRPRSHTGALSPWCVRSDCAATTGKRPGNPFFYRPLVRATLPIVLILLFLRDLQLETLPPLATSLAFMLLALYVTWPCVPSFYRFLVQNTPPNWSMCAFLVRRRPRARPRHPIHFLPPGLLSHGPPSMHGARHFLLSLPCAKRTAESIFLSNLSGPPTARAPPHTAFTPTHPAFSPTALPGCPAPASFVYCFLVPNARPNLFLCVL